MRASLARISTSAWKAPVLAAAVAACSVAAVSPALAVEKHIPLSSSPFGSMSDATGLAVDQSTGNLFVADSNADVVRVFGAEGGAPAGGIPSELTGASTPSGGFSFFENEATGVAVDNACFYHKLSGAACTAFDPSNGAIYVTDGNHKVVDKFIVNGKGEYEYVSQLTGFSEPVYVTVDPEGDVYVVDYASRLIYEFSPTGGEISKYLVSNATIERPFEVAFDAAGDIYVDGYEPYGGMLKLKRGAFVGPVESEEVMAQHGKGFPGVPPSVKGLAFDRATGRLYVGRESNDTGEFFLTEDDEAGNVLSTFDAKAMHSYEHPSTGVAVNEATGYIYDPSAAQTAIEAFGPLVSLGSATTGAASSIGPNGATVEGTVNPESATLEGGCEVQYGKTIAYGNSVPCSPEKVGTGEKPVPVAAELLGLEASTLYHYRVVAVNQNGKSPGPDAALTTAPAVQGVLTGEATGVGKACVTLNGALKPEGIETHYDFEYGETPSYRSATPLEKAAELPEALVSAVVCGLKPNTIYYYRLVAINQFGTTYGAGREVRTLPNDPVVILESASRVFPREALLGAVVNPEGANTTYRFLYGPTASYGSVAPAGEVELGEGETGMQAVLSIEDLLPGTTYHYAIAVTNRGGTTVGPDQTFTTPPAAVPVVVTGAASGVSQNGATIWGTVNPEGVPTSYEFDIGTDTTYGTRVSGEVGSGSEARVLTLNLLGLAAGTVYHYRLVARDSFGTVYGADMTFVTPEYPTAVIVSPLGAPLIPSPVFAAPSTAGAITLTSAPPSSKHAKPRKRSREKRTARSKRRRKASRTTRAGRGGSGR